MRLSSPVVGRGGRVAVHHRPGPPTGDPHEVGLPAARRQPGVGEVVAERMGIDPRHASFGRPPLEHLSNARDAHAALAPEPQPRLSRPIGVLSVDPPVPTRATTASS